MNEKVTSDDRLLSPKVGMQENKTLPTKHLTNANIEVIDMFSSDEEDLTMSDQNDNIIPQSDDLKTLENIVKKEFSTEQADKPSDDVISNKPESEKNPVRVVDKLTNFDSSDNKNKETIEPGHIFL